MKTLYLAALIACCVLSSAYAEIKITNVETAQECESSICGDFSLSTSPSKFTELETLYQQGTLPANEDVVGWYSGRCVLATDPNRLHNNLLIGWTEDVGDGDGGPLFPPRHVLKALSCWVSGESAEYFDELSSEETKLVNNFLADSKPFAIEAFVEDNTLVTGMSNVRWKIRKSGDYRITQLFEGNRVTAYCYQFKKVK